MVYFNSTENANHHSTSSAPDELDAYPFLSQASATEASEALDTFTDGRSVGEQPDHVVCPSRSVRAEGSFGKCNRSLLNDRRLMSEPLETVTSVTSYDTKTHSDGELSFPGYYWPTTGRYAQSHGSSIVSRDNSFASTVALDTSTVASTPSSGNYFP